MKMDVFLVEIIYWFECCVGMEVVDGEEYTWVS